ncbi:MAG TPA: type II toxin-antitoxin system HicA family toxin [Ignavibacteriales bacterium]|nr:type II toxin-antitoxin system HicA family toxin [Ignavibacteriales bacterium]
MKTKELIRIVEKDGWYRFRSEGVIQQFKHTLKMGIITISGRPHDYLAQNSINNILDKAGLR